MKKTMLITMLVLLGALGFTTTAQAASCSDVIWSAEMLETNPNIAGACLDVVDKRGSQSVKLTARVVRQGVNSTIVQWQMPDGSWSASERRFPERGSTAEIGGQTVRIAELAPRQEVNVYIPMAGNWSLPEPAEPVSPSKTSRLDTSLPPEAEGEDVSPTRKKTIRVKRPGERPGVAAAAAVETAPAAQPAPGMVQAPARTGWFFPVVALVAVLVSAVTLYVLAAQTFGPMNASLTRLTYGVPSLNLGWPGKIPPQR